MAAELARRMVADMARGAEPYWLTFAGVPGVGKTWIARQIYVEGRKHNLRATKDCPQQYGTYDERRRRPDCRWIREDEFAQLLLTDKQYDLPEYIAHEWLVGYDDLGTKCDTKARDVMGDALCRLANQRLGKWTLWTTNFTLDEISARIDARVSSRLIRDSNKFLTIQAQDYARTGRKFSPQR